MFIVAMEKWKTRSVPFCVKLAEGVEVSVMTGDALFIVTDKAGEVTTV